MQNKTATKRYFNQEKKEGPAGKKAKVQEKKNPGGKPNASPNAQKKKFGKKMKGIKRKPEEVAKQNGGTPEKKMKVTFPGTGDLNKKNEKKQKSQVAKTAESPSDKTESKRARNEHRRKSRRQVFAKFVDGVRQGNLVNLDQVKAKIETLKSRDPMTKSARRKLKRYQNILKLAGASAEGEEAAKKFQEKLKEKKNQKVVKKQEKKQIKKKLPAKKPVEKKNSEEGEEDSDKEDEEGSDYDTEHVIKLNKGVKKTEEEDSGEEEEEEELDNSNAEYISLEAEEDSGEEEESVEEDEASDDDDEDKDESLQEEESDDEEDDNDENEEEDDNEENDGDEEVVPKKTSMNQRNKQNESPQKGKSRYIVFVGNLPFDVEKSQIVEHFKKVGEVKDVRLITDKNTNKNRGFAYVEFTNEQSYQKALGLNHTFISGRRINVQYTQGGKKKGEEAKKEIKAKNMKLQAMRKQGKFGDGKNPAQKRADRRMKQGSK